MSYQCRRNCPARAFIGSSRECIIHEHNALTPASASVRLTLSAWMPCRHSRIPHALAVFDRRFARLRLTSSRGSVRLDVFLQVGVHSMGTIFQQHRRLVSSRNRTVGTRRPFFLGYLVMRACSLR